MTIYSTLEGFQSTIMPPHLLSTLTKFWLVKESKLYRPRNTARGLPVVSLRNFAGDDQWLVKNCVVNPDLVSDHLFYLPRFLLYNLDLCIFDGVGTTFIRSIKRESFYGTLLGSRTDAWQYVRSNPLTSLNILIYYLSCVWRDQYWVSSMGSTRCTNERDFRLHPDSG